VLIVGQDPQAQGDQRLHDLLDFPLWWTTSGAQRHPALREDTRLAANGVDE
jgi:hypothetical protein